MHLVLSVLQNRVYSFLLKVGYDTIVLESLTRTGKLSVVSLI